MPFSTVKIDWTYDAPNRLVAETRDANADGVRDSGDSTDTDAFDLNGKRVRKQTGWDTNGDGGVAGAVSGAWDAWDASAWSDPEADHSIGAAARGGVVGGVTGGILGPFRQSA